MAPTFFFHYTHTEQTREIYFFVRERTFGKLSIKQTLPQSGDYLVVPMVSVCIFANYGEKEIFTILRKMHAICTRNSSFSIQNIKMFLHLFQFFLGEQKYGNT